MSTCPSFAVNWDHPAWTWWVLGISITVVVVGVGWFLRWMVLDFRREQEALDKALNRYAPDRDDTWDDE